MTVEEQRLQLSGLLFFPITPFGAGGVDADLLATHLSERLALHPRGVRRLRDR